MQLECIPFYSVQDVNFLEIKLRNLMPFEPFQPLKLMTHFANVEGNWELKWATHLSTRLGGPPALLRIDEHQGIVPRTYLLLDEGSGQLLAARSSVTRYSAERRTAELTE